MLEEMPAMITKTRVARELVEPAETHRKPVGSQGELHTMENSGIQKQRSPMTVNPISAEQLG